MKRFQYIIITLLCVAFAASSCYQDDIDDLQDQIDALKDGDVASISEQISAIEASISNLETVCGNLDTYITALQTQASNLETSISETSDKADQIRAELESLQSEQSEVLSDTAEALRNAIALQKAEILAELAELQLYMESELSTINSTISSLQSKNTDFEERIASLEALEETLTYYLESYLSSAETSMTDWSKATLLTLSQYYALSDSVATLKVSMETLNNRLANFADSVSAKLNSEIETAVDSLVAAYISAGLEEQITSKLQEETEALTTAYTEAIATAKDEITTAYTTAIEDAIEDLESSLTSWVNEQLASYYTISQTDAALSALRDSIETQLASQVAYLEALLSEIDGYDFAVLVVALQEKCDSLEDYIASTAETITQLKSDIASFKEDVAEAYNDAVEEAITELEGTLSSAVEEINATLASKISEVNETISGLEERISALETRLSDIEAAIEEAEDDLEDLLARIQSISFVSEYSDGTATMSYTYVSGTTQYSPDSCVLNFTIRPADCATEVAANWETVLSSNAVYTQTRSADLFDMTILSASADDEGTLTVVLSGEGLSDEFFNEEVGLSACIEISDGSNCISSEYVTIVPVYYGETSSSSSATLVSSWEVYYYNKEYFSAYKQYYDEIVFYTASTSRYVYGVYSADYYETVGIDAVIDYRQEVLDEYVAYYDSLYYDGYYLANNVLTTSAYLITNLELDEEYYGFMFYVDENGDLTGEYQVSEKFSSVSTGASDAYNAWVGTWDYTDADGETGTLIFVERELDSSYAVYETSQSSSIPATEVAFNSSDGSVTFSFEDLDSSEDITSDGVTYSCEFYFVGLIENTDGSSSYVLKNTQAHDIASGSMDSSYDYATISGLNFLVESREAYYDASGMGFCAYNSENDKIFTPTSKPAIALPCTLGTVPSSSSLTSFNGGGMERVHVLNQGMEVRQPMSYDVRSSVVFVEGYSSYSPVL